MIKILMKSIREYKLPSILSPIFVAVEVFLEVLIPLMCADLINFLTPNELTGMHVFSIFGMTFPSDVNQTKQATDSCLPLNLPSSGLVSLVPIPMLITYSS